MDEYNIIWEKHSKVKYEAEIGKFNFIIDKFNDDKTILRILNGDDINYKSYENVKDAKKGAEKTIKKRIKSIKEELLKYELYENRL